MTAIPIAYGRGTIAGPVGANRSDPEAWMWIGEAARRLGRSESSIRRRCAAWEQKGLAEKAVDGATGRRRWRIHIAADHGLRAITPSLSLATDDNDNAWMSAEAELQSATPAAAALAVAKARALIAFRAWRMRDGVNVTRDYADFSKIARADFGLAPSLTQIYQWSRLAPGGEIVSEIARSLLDKRRRSGRWDAVSEDAWRLFADLYLTPNQLSVAHCWRIVVSESRRRSWSWPSLRRVQQLVRERLSKQVVDYHRLGRDAWAKRHAAPMDQDPEAWGIGECWESDHTTADVYVQIVEGGQTVARRPVVTAWLDRRSRLLVGHVVSLSGNSDTIRAALLGALKRGDVDPPKYSWLDNGKDFASEQFTGRTKKERRDDAPRQWDGLFARLGIQNHFAQPYNHNGKARIERFFGTLHADFDRTFSSWCGSDPKQVDKLARRDLLSDASKLPTLDDYRVMLDDWIEWYNHRSEHAIDDLVDPVSREKLSPTEMYVRRTERRILDDAGALALLEQAWGRPMKVSKRGVGLRMAGRTVRYGSTHPALQDLKGTDRRVYVTYDPADTTRVRIYDEQFRFLCVAPENESYGGLDPITIDARKAAMVERRRIEKRVRQRVDTTSLTLTDHELARKHQRDMDIAATRQKLKKDGVLSPAAQLRIVKTGLAGQNEKVAVVEQRLAAGAEGQATPRRASRALILDSLAARQSSETIVTPKRHTIFDLTGDAQL